MLRIHGIINQHASIFTNMQAHGHARRPVFRHRSAVRKIAPHHENPRQALSAFSVLQVIVAGAFAAGVSVAGVSVDRELANNTEGVRA